jgi:hypothetical protein
MNVSFHVAVRTSLRYCTIALPVVGAELKQPEGSAPTILSVAPAEQAETAGRISDRLIHRFQLSI